MHPPPSSLHRAQNHCVREIWLCVLATWQELQTAARVELLSQSFIPTKKTPQTSTNTKTDRASSILQNGIAQHVKGQSCSLLLQNVST